MRIIIYGAGAIGGVVGGHLVRVGQDVIFIGRPGNVKAIQQNGLRLITPENTHTLPVTAVTSPEQIIFQKDDVVFLCVKGPDTKEALVNLRAKTGDNMPIFCLQNGVRNEEIALRYFPKVYGVRVHMPAYYLIDGEVTAGWDPPGGIIIGRYPEGTDDLAEAVAENLRIAGFFAVATTDIMPFKWGKLIGNLSNSIIAITNTGGERIKAMVTAARLEAQDILTKAAIPWVSAEQMAAQYPQITTRSRENLFREAQSSTWQSLVRRPGTVETDFLTGEIVSLAKNIGHPAPINSMLYHIILDMAANCEPPGRYTSDRLSELLGLT